MNMRLILMVFCGVVGLSPWVWAEGTWRVQADVVVPKPSLVEVVLPLKIQGNNLRVVGPEGQTRVMELYWRDEVGLVEENVEAQSVRLLPNGSILWEGKIKTSQQTEKIIVRISEVNFMGKVSVQGLVEGRWVSLADDAAIYQGEGNGRAEIPIPKGTYASFRLTFKAFNQMNKKRLVPVEQVAAFGRPIGKDFIAETVALHPQVTKEGDETILTATLPGTAFWVEKVILTTQGEFSGEASLGCEEVVGGVRQFVPINSGAARSIGKGSNELKVEVGGGLPNRILVWRLKNQHYLGPILSWTVTVRCPRLRFRADPAGLYHIQNGGGQGIVVLESPTIDPKIHPFELSLGSVKENNDWKPESLVEKSPLGGGPFEGRGYSWRAAVETEGEGYYRLPLDLTTSLDEKVEGLRIVRGNKQVPYFWGKEEKGVVPIPYREEYDQAKNKTTWTLTLPVASERWGDLVLESEGVFKRSVVLERKYPGTRVWESWHQWSWENETNGKSETRISLGGLNDKEVRLMVEHKDNRPIPLHKASAEYKVLSLCFLADQAGGYSLYGGTPKVVGPQYDLSLVQNELMDREPQIAKMGERKEFSGRGFKSRFFEKFQETNMGLYAVLGFVTLVLLILVGWLFPKADGSKKKRKSKSL